MIVTTKAIEALYERDIKQVEMIPLLRAKGIIVQPPELSQALRGVTTNPKAKRIVETVMTIIKERYDNR